MLEIFLIIALGKKLSALAVEKGRSKGWAALGAGFWFGGEVMGFIIGGLLDLGMGAYLIALVFAGIGAGVAYGIVKGLPPIGNPVEPAL